MASSFGIKMGIVILLILGLTYGTASSDKSLLTQFYKKAAQESRPLVLVLDSNLNKRPQEDRKPNILQNLVGTFDKMERNVQSSNKNYKNRDRSSSSSSSKVDFYQNLLLRLKSIRDRVLKDRDDGRGGDRNDNRNRVRYNDKDENTIAVIKALYRNLQRDENKNNQGRDERNKQRYRDSYDRIKDDRDRQGKSSNDRDRNDGDKNDRNGDSFFNSLRNQTPKNSYLRTSVLKNLLRISNDLNCDAQNQCKNECGGESAEDSKGCEDECSVKYDCDNGEDTKPDTFNNNRSGNNCMKSDEDFDCSVSEEIYKSTKGYAETDPPASCIRC